MMLSFAFAVFFLSQNNLIHRKQAAEYIRIWIIVFKNFILSVTSGV